MKGIDVSAWNTITDWSAAKKAGVEFAMIRAGYGRGNFGRAEPQIHKRINEAHAAGIHVGLYWFSYAHTPDQAAQEADEILDIARQHIGQIDFPIAFDWEYDSDDYAKRCGISLNNSLRTAITKAFLDRVEAAGYYAINYTNGDYLQNKLHAAELTQYDLWYAAPGVAQPPRECGIWQYSWHGKIPGLIGDVDLNLAYKDYPTLIKQLGLNGFKADAPAQPVPVIPPTPQPKPEQEEKVIKISYTTEAERQVIMQALRNAR